MPGGRSHPAPKRRMLDLRLWMRVSSWRRVVRWWEGRGGGLLVVFWLGGCCGLGWAREGEV